jgi:serine protease Do
MKIRNIYLLLLIVSSTRLVALEPPDRKSPIPPSNSVFEDQKAPIAIDAPSTKGSQSSDPLKLQKFPEKLSSRTENSSAYMGLSVLPIPDVLAKHFEISQNEAVIVHIVDPHGPAALAGISERDILTAVDHIKPRNHQSLRDILVKHQPGDSINVSLIHRGHSIEKSLVLVARSSQNITPNQLGVDELQSSNDIFNSIPKEQADHLRKAIEQNLNALKMHADSLAIPKEQADFPMNEIHKRIQRMMGGTNQSFIFPNLSQDQVGGNSSVQSQTNVRVMDQEGSVHLRESNGKKEITVFDKKGNSVWSGSYNSAAEKESVPESVRKRIEALNGYHSVEKGLGKSPVDQSHIE